MTSATLSQPGIKMPDASLLRGKHWWSPGWSQAGVFPNFRGRCGSRTWSPKWRKSLAPLLSQDRTHSAQLGGVKSSSPKAETHLLGPRSKCHRRQAGATGAQRHWGRCSGAGCRPFHSPEILPTASPKTHGRAEGGSELLAVTELQQSRQW